MYRGRPVKLHCVNNSQIYMDLKDIIRESALKFLPAKSLFRFKCVCRDWKLHISTPFFAHNQSLSCRAGVGFLFQAPGEPPSFIGIDPRSFGVPDRSLSFLPEPVIIRSSSNGLLFCLGRTNYKAYYVCNPATQQWKELPKPNADHGHHPAIVLIFEPSLLNFEADYKLVCAFPSNDFDGATEFEIYSSKEGSWKISGEICFADLKINPTSGVHVNGIVYWKGRGLLTYDLAKDRSQVFKQLPIGTLGTTDGKLSVFSFYGREIRLNILENAHSNTMQMSSSSRMWKVRELVGRDKEVLGNVLDQNVIVIAASGDLVVFKSSGKLYSYNFQTKERNTMSITSYSSDMICLPYVSSLASL